MVQRGFCFERHGQGSDLNVSAVWLLADFGLNNNMYSTSFSYTYETFMKDDTRWRTTTSERETMDMAEMGEVIVSLSLVSSSAFASVPFRIRGSGGFFAV